MLSLETKQIDTAFVLGSGGNRGVLQAGALFTLMQHDIIPQLIVGTSVGSLNALQIASDPTVKGAEELIDIWHGVRKEMFRRAGFFAIGRRLLKNSNSLTGNERLQAYVAQNMPPGRKTFADFPVQLRTIAANLSTGQMHVFGDDPAETVFDAVMASISIPIYMPPWEYRGAQYVDGGVVSALPVMTALKHKPKKVYIIDISSMPGTKQTRFRGMIDIVNRIIDIQIQHQVRYELETMALQKVQVVYHIGLNTFTKTPLWDMAHVEEMISSGQEIMAEFLNRKHPDGYVKYNTLQSE